MNRTLELYRSNRTEVLVDALAELLGEPGGGPLDPPWVVVQGRGMAVWLALEMARRHGVWAARGVVYPRKLVLRAFERVLGDAGAEAAAFSRERLPWAVMAALDGLLDNSAFARLKRYVARDDGGRRRHQLAERIADTFDQYLTYRPDVLLAWERGDDTSATDHDEGWQPRLWRELVARAGARHAASLERDFIEALSRPRVDAALPSRIVVFGLATLPPMYVRVLSALSQHVDVHWFMPSPARGYWADIASARAALRALERGASPEAMHLDRGNPLLASFGRLGAEMIDVMQNELDAMSVAEVEPMGDLFRDPDDTTVLGRLQADVLAVRASHHTGTDDSISMHACHGPMREVEVLHDRLLALLAHGGAIRPHDIVVMMPDVETYAPLVEAVFERDRGTPRFVPYAIADRSTRVDSPVVDGLLRMLALVGSRARASEVLDLLTVEPVQRCFDIAPEELDRIASWVKDAGVRWGLDARHRAVEGQPPVHETTWRFGIERLLLGYAMPGEGRTLYAGRLPFDEIEGTDAQLAGKLAAYIEVVFDFMSELSEPRTMEGWHSQLTLLLERMLAHDADNAWQHRRVLEALTTLRDAVDAAGYDGDISVEVMRAVLEDTLGDTEAARGFLAGGVTFCAMVPMRSIPFAVVCMLGMSDGAFPRSRRPVDFDLMARERRAGDRSRRDDDRYLFLEALMSARKQVIITWVGQSIRDDQKLPPSVVVSDLIDHLVQSYDREPTTADEDEDQRVARVHPTLLTRHPLQPFSPRYFDGSDPNLFSYVAARRDGAASLLGHARRPVRPLFDGALPERPEDAAATPVAIHELGRFFESPIGYLMNRRLGIDLRERGVELSNREPAVLDPLERYQLGDALLSLCIDGVDEHTTQQVARASGAIPPGTPGNCDHDDVMAVVGPLAERVLGLREGGRRPDLLLEATLPDGTAITGEIGERWAKGLLWHQFARISGKRLLSLWVRHLALCWLGEPLAPRKSYLVSRAEAGDALSCVAYRRVSDPEAHLSALVSLYRIGQREPLLLFPKAGLRYARSLRGGKKESQALRDATTVFLQEEHGRDPHLRRAADVGWLEPGARAFDGALGPSFAELAMAVFDPLLAHLDDVDGGGA